MAVFFLRLLQGLTCLAGIHIFFHGFLPIKTHSHIPSSNNVLNDRVSHVSRVVMVVVDALRTDFVSLHTGKNWPYLETLIRNKKAYVADARVHPPTVTLPRIKAMSSGDIPGFVDVIMNFDSPAMTSDNILHRMAEAGKSTVFYGDDTWLKLFPDAFLRHEGVTSFFVSDYTEVDANVTRHLDRELAASDWSMMILHYLGLDHIGHLIGPSSHLIPTKLQEMDQVVKKVHTSLTKQGLTDYLIVVCGDHGMADQGGHGGVSAAEVHVPLVFISDRDFISSDSEREVYQIDLVPTLSALLSLPIPDTNLGVAIPHVLESLASFDYMIDSIVDNSKQLSRLLSQEQTKEREQFSLRLDMLHTQYQLVNQSKATHNSITDRKRKLLKEYVNVCIEMRETIASRLVDYDATAMTVGLVLITVTFGSVICSHRMPLDNMWLTLVGVLFTAGLAVYQTYCSSLLHSKNVCNLPWTYGYPILASALVASIGRSLYVTKPLREDITPRGHYRLMTLGLPVLHSISLLSSSYIEEEHMLAYYYSSSILIVLLLSSIAGSGVISPRHARLVFALVLMSLAREWNQTGDKWSHLPDIADKLNEPDYTAVKSSLAIVSNVIAMYVTVPRRRPTFLVIVWLISTMSTIAFILQDMRLLQLSSRGTVEANVVYVCVAVTITVATCYSLTGRSASTVSELIRYSWLMLTLLLHKASNVPVMCLVTLIDSLIGSSLRTSDLPLLPLLYYWLGQAFYFYQGNSNRLSSVDVAAGYKGMIAYNPAITGFLMFCSTYSGPVFCFFSLIKHTDKLGARATSIIKELSSLYFGMKLADMMVLMFLIIIERYHLFIWTVFAPKLLYEIVWLTLYTVFYTLPYK